MRIRAEPRLRDVPLASGGHIRLAEFGQGAPVVMVHGAGLGASGVVHFHANIDAFVDAGYRVVVPDLIGFGASSKPVDDDGYPLERFTDTLVEALTRAGITRSAFFGNSLGGAISIDAALRYPDLVARAVLIAPGALESRETYFAQPMVQRMLVPQQGEMDEARMRTMLESFVSDRSAVSDEAVAARALVARTQPPEVLGTMRLPDLTARLGELRQPVLVVWGAEDGICPVSGALKFAVGCSDATVIVYSGVGHWPMTERPDAVNAAALEFLSR